MATETLTERAPSPDAPETPQTGLDRALAHPGAFIATAVILLALFAFPFISDQSRVAPTKDPAFYTWRTEALITEEPVRLLEIEGAKGMYAAGYRVAAPILGGMLRHLPGVGQLSVITFMMVGLPVLISLLLAGFAYRQRRDAILFHSVAFATGGLLLTPPFVGYLDNVLCLFWLAAALFFIEGTRTSWSARLVFGMFLLLAGLTHPTTLAIFCVILGAMAAARLVYRRFDFRSVLRDDGPMLLTGFAAAVVTVLVWSIGIWGKSVSLSEAALPPPYDSDFFVDRMMLWVNAMTPALNGPLFLIGLVGVLIAGRKAAEDELSRVSVVWLAPLAGLFGFLAGLTYPYYRFFNTTLSWVLLVGVGGWIIVRFLPPRFAVVGLVAIAAVFGLNFVKGFDLSGWTNPNNQWLPPQTRADLDVLRGELAEQDPDTPVVFVVDDDPAKGFQVYGSSKLAGNISRYGLPNGMIDQSYVYLGDVSNFLQDRPTTVEGNETYNELSPSLLQEFEENSEGREPIVVVASAFNAVGANVEIASGEATAPDGVWVVRDGTVTRGETTTDVVAQAESSAPATHLVRVLAGLFLLLLPGLIAFRRVLPTGELPEALGLVPALSAGLLAVAGIVVLAAARSSFSMTLAWVTLAVAGAAGFALARRSGTPAA